MREGPEGGGLRRGGTRRHAAARTLLVKLASPPHSGSTDRRPALRYIRARNRYTRDGSQRRSGVLLGVASSRGGSLSNDDRVGAALVLHEAGVGQTAQSPKDPNTKSTYMTLKNVPRFARTDTPKGTDGSTAESEADKLQKPPNRRAAAKRFREIELTTWLQERHELDPRHARAVAMRLLSSTARIRGGFQKWWLTGRVEDIEIEGYSLRRLVEEKGMSPLGALLTLSLLESGGAPVRERVDRKEPGDVDVEETLELMGG